LLRRKNSWVKFIQITWAIPKLRDILDISNPFENLDRSRVELVHGLTHLLNNAGLDPNNLSAFSLRTEVIKITANFNSWPAEVIDLYLTTSKNVLEGIKEIIQSFADPNTQLKELLKKRV
jgi:hypothetical protein